MWNTSKFCITKKQYKPDQPPTNKESSLLPWSGVYLFRLYGDIPMYPTPGRPLILPQHLRPDALLAQAERELGQAQATLSVPSTNDALDQVAGSYTQRADTLIPRRAKDKKEIEADRHLSQLSLSGSKTLVLLCLLILLSQKKESSSCRKWCTDRGQILTHSWQMVFLCSL